MTDLERHWQRCFEDLDAPRPPPCIFEELQARYNEPHRAYHTLQHLEECFGWFEAMRGLMRQPGEIALALFYHDAIYDTHARDNEDRSADLALDVLDTYTGADNSQRYAVKDLILATKHDALPKTPDAQILVDIDLSILGAPRDRFDEYERQVRQEYYWVEDKAFAEGRGRILRQFLARSVLYNTAWFRRRLEQPARESLIYSLARLESNQRQ